MTGYPKSEDSAPLFEVSSLRATHKESACTAGRFKKFFYSLLGISALGLAMVGCEAPREPSERGIAPEQATLDSSPSMEAANASSGTTQEAYPTAPLDSVAAREQLNRTTNPAADTTWGDWAVDSATIAGEPMPQDLASTISLYIDASSYIANIGEQVDKGTVVVRKQAMPMELDITGVDGPNAGKTILAIFEQPDANTLVVCYSFNENERPTEFSSTSANGQFLVKYRRKAGK